MKEWLSSEIEKVEKTYLIKATNMTGPYRREIGLKKEYDGRQLMELIQNADDEAEKAKDPALLIRLEKKRLIVANDGKPFSKSGVRSLIDSDNSPKIMRRRKIGYKGLGFRALLNWSDSIGIKSGGFSKEDRDVRKKVNNYSMKGRCLNLNYGLGDYSEATQYPLRMGTPSI